EEENMRRTNGTSAKNNLVAGHDKGFTTPLDLDPGGTCAIEQEATHQTVGLNRQVQPMPGLTQMTEGSAIANPVGVVEWSRADAGRFWMVMVRTVREPGGATRLVEGDLAREPGITRKPAGDDGARSGMK